jgi:hypothetical protein
VNVEIPPYPDFDGREIDEEGIVPGRAITLRLLNMALGSRRGRGSTSMNSSNAKMVPYWVFMRPSVPKHG